MAITRPDEFITASFTRANGNWTMFVVEWREAINDGAVTWDRQRSETYLIADLPAQVRTDLQNAWAGMQVHRDSITPIS